MATQGNEGQIDPADLSDEELEALQQQADGEEAGTNPPAGEEEGTEGAAAPAAAPAATPAASPAPAPAEAAAAPAAGAEADTKAKVDGVANKDGTRVLPYSALQAERRAARAANGRAAALEKDLAAARQQLEDIKAGRATGSDELTEEKVAAMEAEYPEEGKKLRTAFNRIKDLEAKVPKAPEPQEPGDDAVQEAIDQVPLLLKWQHEDAEKFTRAQEIDAVLLKSPKWVGKPALERFNKVAEMVADEYDIPFESTEKPKASPAAAPAATPPAQPQVARKPPETLSDFKGGDPSGHDSLNAERASPHALLARYQDMTDEEIDAQLAKLG